MVDTVSELLPCPFCGGAAYLNRPSNGFTPFVMCKSCQSAGTQAEPSRAISAWNTRASTQPAPAFPKDEVEAKLEAIERHANSLVALSEWLIAQWHMNSTELPDEVGDPEDAADLLRSLGALLQGKR